MRHRLSSLLALLALLPSLALAHGPAPKHPHHRFHPRSSVNFGLSIGSGFYSPGYYSSGYYSSGYYSPYWYGPSVIYSAPVYTPPRVVYTPAQVVYAQPVYVQPAPAWPPETGAYSKCRSWWRAS